MILDEIHCRRIASVAKALGEMADQCVFIGGATVSLYVEDEASGEIRTTDDVDLVVDLATITEFWEFEARLGKKGFRPARTGPICRYEHDGILVDFVHKGGGQGFSNPWYPAGVASAETVELPGGVQIKVFPLAYFLASKVAAYHGRGEKDCRMSKDVEDIVRVLDGRRDLVADFRGFKVDVAAFLRTEFGRFLGDGLFLEAVRCNFHGPVADQRAARLVRLLTDLR